MERLALESLKSSLQQQLDSVVPATIKTMGNKSLHTSPWIGSVIQPQLQASQLLVRKGLGGHKALNLSSLPPRVWPCAGSFADQPDLFTLSSTASLQRWVSSGGVDNGEKVPTQ
ncbi:hypothetical protein ABBQ38_000796 [Trebouxia sp. C0009 RCD-2024]